MTAPTAGISMITLGVRELDTSLKFYTALGWRDTPHSQTEVKFLAGHNIVLGLYGRAALAEDAMVEDGATGFAAVTLAVNLATRDAVDDYFAAALDAGATALKTPREAFWGGYSGYFADPDGHLWETAHNPFFPIAADGRLDLLTEAGS